MAGDLTCLAHTIPKLAEWSFTCLQASGYEISNQLGRHGPLWTVALEKTNFILIWEKFSYGPGSPVLGPVTDLGDASESAPVCRAGDWSSNPGPGKNFTIKFNNTQSSRQAVWKPNVHYCPKEVTLFWHNSLHTQFFILYILYYYIIHCLVDRYGSYESLVINQKAWQLNSGSELRKFANTQKNNSQRIAKTQKNMFTFYFIHTVYPKV